MQQQRTTTQERYCIYELDDIISEILPVKDGAIREIMYVQVNVISEINLYYNDINSQIIGLPLLVEVISEIIPLPDDVVGER